jgi:hypothetical protein
MGISIGGCIFMGIIIALVRLTMKCRVSFCNYGKYTIFATRENQPRGLDFARSGWVYYGVVKL